MGTQIKREITIMKMIQHKNVVAVKNVFATSSKIFIVLEIVNGGELFDKIAKAGKLTEDKAKFYYRQVLEGIDYCHSVGVCHRDLSELYFNFYFKINVVLIESISFRTGKFTFRQRGKCKNQ